MFKKPIIFLATKNAEASKEFYKCILGLEFISGDPYALVFNVGGTELRIQVVEDVKTVPYTSLGWAVINIEEASYKLRANGVEFERYPHLTQDKNNIWHAPSDAKIAWFKDPDGNILSITQYKNS